MESLAEFFLVMKAVFLIHLYLTYHFLLLNAFKMDLSSCLYHVSFKGKNDMHRCHFWSSLLGTDTCTFPGKRAKKWTFIDLSYVPCVNFIDILGVCNNFNIKNSDIRKLFKKQFWGLLASLLRGEL